MCSYSFDFVKYIAQTKHYVHTYPANIAPRSAINHSGELNPTMPTAWYCSNPIWNNMVIFLPCFLFLITCLFIYFILCGHVSKKKTLIYQENQGLRNNANSFHMTFANYLDERFRRFYDIVIILFVRPVDPFSLSLVSKSQPVWKFLHRLLEERGHGYRFDGQRTRIPHAQFDRLIPFCGPQVSWRQNIIRSWIERRKNAYWYDENWTLGFLTNYLVNLLLPCSLFT